MKKVLKRIALALAILLFVVFSVIGVALWFVFTPERLTPVVRKQAAQFLTCQSEVERVELTFFSTFPKFGLKVSGFALINPMPDAQSDTLVRLDELIGVVDVGVYWKRGDIVLNELIVRKGSINAFVDSLGRPNFDITPPDTAVVEDTSASSAFKLDIHNVELDGVDLSYVDRQSKMAADVRALSLQMSGAMDSVNLITNINLKNSLVSFDFEGAKYLDSADIKFAIPSKVVMARSFVEFDESVFSINGIELSFKGTVENDTVNRRINTDVEYELRKFPVSTAIALIPASFQSYLKGIEVDGFFESDGKVSGFYTDSVMPLMDIHMVFTDGTLKYDALPLPLSSINGDFTFYSDLKNDKISYFKINSFSANTPKSSFGTKGVVNHLFSDIRIDLNSQIGRLNLSELKPFIPEDMNIKMKGIAAGNVQTAFSMSQVEKMLLDKMRIAGSVTLSDFDFAFDSIFMKTNKTKVDFALPNPNKQNKYSQYLYSKVQAENVEAGILKGPRTFIRNGIITVETSDVMDTTRLPDVACVFDIDSLAASMDTIDVQIRKPKGKLVMLSQKGPSRKDEVAVTYSNLGLNAKAGESTVKLDKTHLVANVLNFMDAPKIDLECEAANLSAAMDGNSVDIVKFSINTNLVNDPTQKDSLLQWMPKGTLSLDKGIIRTAMLNSPLEIPSIKMNFSPEVFDIKESHLKIDRSDFSLSGTLTNMLSYYRGDSLLTGSFDFVSSHTDVLQLMSLTSGIGDENVEPAPPVQSTDSTSAMSAYMVPKGIDVSLKTKIDRALFGTEIARDIRGEVRVKDGLLVLDNLRFTTPASRMQLTAMYKTPRKNHVYAGFHYHMLDIQIEDLLKMVPSIDTMMPMLRSFKGNAEFHIAAETYMDSMYNPKMATIRGVSSIKGNNLVLMDGETFTEIAKTLRFTKGAENKVDSLSAEFTLFKDQVDIYPFMIVMDKYKAVVAGRHNLDMSFSYNVSLLESPLPVKICVDVNGTLDDLKVKPFKCRYEDLTRPASRNLLQKRQLELRRMIRESLVKKVVED